MARWVTSLGRSVRQSSKYLNIRMLEIHHLKQAEIYRQVG